MIKKEKYDTVRRKVKVWKVSVFCTTTRRADIRLVGVSTACIFEIFGDICPSFWVFTPFIVLLFMDYLYYTYVLDIILGRG